MGEDELTGDEWDVFHFCQQIWLMIGQKSAKCDLRLWRVPVTLENAFSEKKHSVTRVTSVTL